MKFSKMQKEIFEETKFTIFNIKKNIQNSSELRGSFIISVVGMILNNSSFLIIWLVFGGVMGTVGGWKQNDVFGLLGFSTVTFGIIITFLGGIRDLPEYVLNGSFDRFMLAPKNILLRVCTSKIYVSAIGDLAFGVLCLAFWFYYIGFSLNNLLLALFFILFGSLCTFGYFVFASSVSFYFKNPRNIVFALFELYLGPSIYHGGAIQGGLRKFLIFIVPALLSGALPVEIIKDPEITKILVYAGISIFWLVFSIWFFYKSLKKYESSNFVNFG